MEFLSLALSYKTSFSVCVCLSINVFKNCIENCHLHGQTARLDKREMLKIIVVIYTDLLFTCT